MGWIWGLVGSGAGDLAVGRRASLGGVHAAPPVAELTDDDLEEVVGGLERTHGGVFPPGSE